MRSSPLPDPTHAGRRSAAPSWVVSLLLHAMVLVALGIALKTVTKGISADTTREVDGEIVLKHFTERGEFFEGVDDGKTPTAASSSTSAADVLNNLPPAVPSVPLPSGDIGNPNDGESGGGGGVDSLVGGPSQPRAGGGGGTKTTFYGIESQGNSFVFVVDRSASMNHSGRMAAAKGELRAAIKYLRPTDQFQIIFYNSGLQSFNPDRGKAFTADERIKRLADQYIAGVTAAEATDAFHSALRRAMNYHPDVIYFLTDAEDIRLSSAELALLRRNNQGTTIHTIKFGEGAEERIPWLVKLAAESGGKYRYVDTRAFVRRP